MTVNMKILSTLVRLVKLVCGILVLQIWVPVASAQDKPAEAETFRKARPTEIILKDNVATYKTSGCPVEIHETNHEDMSLRNILPSNHTWRLEGKITETAVDRLETELVNNTLNPLTAIRAVSLHSSGGDPRQAIRLGLIIERLNLDTVVETENECDSACTIAFFGGINRSIAPGAEFGVHSPSIGEPYFNLDDYEMGLPIGSSDLSADGWDTFLHYAAPGVRLMKSEKSGELTATNTKDINTNFDDYRRIIKDLKEIRRIEYVSEIYNDQHGASQDTAETVLFLIRRGVNPKFIREMTRPGPEVGIVPEDVFNFLVEKKMRPVKDHIESLGLTELDTKQRIADAMGSISDEVDASFDTIVCPSRSVLVSENVIGVAERRIEPF